MTRKSITSLLFTLALVGGTALTIHAPGAHADSRYGPDGCASGFVWREAFVGDQICVLPWVRSEAANDNAAAASRRNPYGPYGPLSCIRGFVWREAFPGDRVCVTPGIRSLTAFENAHPNQHRHA